MRTRHWVDTYTPKYTAALFTTAKVWKQSNFLPRDKRIKKIWYICNEIFGLERKGWKKSCHYRRVTARAGRQGANLAPEMASSTKLWAGPQLLTKSSWDPGQLTSTRRAAVRDELPRGGIRHTWGGAPAAAGTGEAIRRTALLGRVRWPSTRSPELLQPGKGTKRRPHRVCAFVEHPRTWTWAGETWEANATQRLV